MRRVGQCVGTVRGVGTTSSRLRRASRTAARQPVVSIVYGSFERGYSHRDATRIKVLGAAQSGLTVHEPQTGEKFDFDSLKQTE